MNNRDNYNKIYDNAVNHLNASKVLAENLHYGYAISHIVLGIEELIKYQVMETHSSATDVFKENEVNQEKSKSIFRNHQTKHELLAEFIKACSKEFVEIFQESIFYSATGQSLKLDHIQIQQNRFKEIGNIINGAFSEANFTEEERRTCLLWLKNANTNKNDGFYVDFNGNAWKAPSDFSKADYELAFKYSSVILKQTTIIKELDISDDELIDFLNSDM